MQIINKSSKAYLINTLDLSGFLVYEYEQPHLALQVSPDVVFLHTAYVYLLNRHSVFPIALDIRDT